MDANVGWALLITAIAGLSATIGSVLGWVLAIVAGIMVYISMDELIPASREHGEDNCAIIGAIAGMAVMAFSL